MQTRIDYSPLKEDPLLTARGIAYFSQNTEKNLKYLRSSILILILVITFRQSFQFAINTFANEMKIVFIIYHHLETS